MRTRLQTAPAFVQLLVLGLLTGLIVGVLDQLTDHGSWPGSLGYGLVFGLFMAVVNTLTTRRRRSDVDAMTAGLTPVQRVEATRTSVRAPVPEDLQVRQAAIVFADYRLREVNRNRVGSRWAGGVLVAMFVALAVLTSPFFWIGVALFVCAVVQDLIEPRRLRRRIELLRAADAGQAAIV